MHTSFEKLLGEPGHLTEFFQQSRLQNVERATVNLQGIAAGGVPVGLLEVLVRQLAVELPRISDPDMALNNLERFFAASRSPLALAALFERDASAVPILLKIFSTSQYLTDLLVRDPSSYDALRMTAGQPVTRAFLIDEIGAALSVVDSGDNAAAMAILRRFKHRETLRIAFGDIIGRQDLRTVTEQISHLADALCTAAYEFAWRKLVERYGPPVTRPGEPCPGTVIAMGKLGGSELNYSSDIDLVFFYLADGSTGGPRVIENRDFFDRLGREFVRLLTENTPLGVAWRVDLRLRPGGAKAPIACSIDNALGYYDLRGRTWERQALVKARPVAGDLPLGQRLLGRLEGWIYARRLSVAGINGIKALKRQIERRTRQDGDDETNVKTGHGGIRDIEFVIQFLQLLHGSESKSVRTGNTLEAIDRLYQAGGISSQEKALLDNGYRWLRRLEHRLQIMFDLQTHSLPESDDELYRVARRMDVTASSPRATLQKFRQQLRHKTRHHRNILDHLLHDAFGEDESGEASREGDLVLDSHLDEATVQQILAGYGFENPLAAHRNLLLLATERNRFLSARRCRHFLAAIARQLLREIARTPQPDETLLNLTRVSDSLGGKAAIWELFRVHPPFLRLYVSLCASCEYLCNVLTRNPGMIDELTDSLVLQELPSLDTLQQSLRELLANAEDIAPIIHRFRDARHLRVGIRDITGRDEIAKTHRALADVAEVCVREVVAIEYRKLVQKYDPPPPVPASDDPMIVLAMGKLGGREPNYHSDLDLVFLYHGEDSGPAGRPAEWTSHQDFFSRLAANVTRTISSHGPYGKLYEIDSRLRPTGKSGSLAVSIREFRRYFLEGSGQLWERLALCKARPLVGDEAVAARLRELIHELVTCRPWEPAHASEIAAMRLRMQEGASLRNIKRGLGGTVDVEFAVQMLQLKHAARYPDVLVPNTVLAATRLHQQQLLSTDDFEFFCQSYQMLRWVEARLRLMNTAARHDLPESPASLASLAQLLGYHDPRLLLEEVDFLRRENRRRFSRLVDSHGRQVVR